METCLKKIVMMKIMTILMKNLKKNQVQIMIEEEEFLVQVKIDGNVKINGGADIAKDKEETEDLTLIPLLLTNI